MKEEKQYYVYIITNKFNRVLYIGVTNNLERWMYEHKNKLVKGFSSKYNLNKLLYYKSTGDVMSALNREKEIKGWLRIKKVKLIKEMNPRWNDLNITLLNMSS